MSGVYPLHHSPLDHQADPGFGESLCEGAALDGLLEHDDSGVYDEAVQRQGACSGNRNTACCEIASPTQDAGMEAQSQHSLTRKNMACKVTTKTNVA